MVREEIDNEFEQKIPQEWVSKQVKLSIIHDKKNNSYYTYLPRALMNMYIQFPEKLCYYITEHYGKKKLWLDEVWPDQETVTLTKSRVNSNFVIVSVGNTRVPRITIPRLIIKQIPKIKEIKTAYAVREYIKDKPLDYVRWSIIF